MDARPLIADCLAATAARWEVLSMKASSRTLALGSAVAVSVIGVTVACGSSSKTGSTASPSVPAATPSAAVSILPGSRSWTTTITDGSHSYATKFVLGPVQQLSAYPGGVAALVARCEAVTGLHFSASGDALVHGTLTVTHKSGSAEPVAVMLDPLQSPPLVPALTQGTSCNGSDLRGLKLKLGSLGSGATAVRDDFVFIMQGYYSPAHPQGDPAVANQSFIAMQVPGTATVAPLSGPGAYQRTVPVVASADAAAYCHKTGKGC